MEYWWVKNQEAIQQYDIRSIAHACITAVPARVAVYTQKRAESQKALRMMLHDGLGNHNSSHVLRSFFSLSQLSCSSYC